MSPITTPFYVSRERLQALRGLPQVIVVERAGVAGRTLDAWAYANNVFSSASVVLASRVEKADVESFNGKVRDERLNEEEDRKREALRLSV